MVNDTADGFGFDVFTAPRTVPLAGVRPRQRVAVTGVVEDVMVDTWGPTPALEATVAGPGGQVTATFLGRNTVAGIEPGRQVVVAGTVLARDGRLVLLNPYVWLPERAPALV